MSAQTVYRHTTQIGAAGGIIDLAPYAIDTFINEEDTGVLKCGVGVVSGEQPGAGVALPFSADERFEGVVVNNRTREYDLESRIYIRNGAAVGVMRYGRVYVRVAPAEFLDGEIKYNDPVYVIANDTENAGSFTNKAAGAIEVAGRFMGGVDNGVAPVELFNPNFTVGGTSALEKIGLSVPTDDHAFSNLEGKKANDLVGEDISVAVTSTEDGPEGAVTGTVKKVTGWTQFSNNKALQDGYFFPVVLDPKYKTLTVTAVGPSGEEKTASDNEWIVRLSNGTASTITFKDGTTGEQIIKLTFNGATLSAD